MLETWIVWLMITKPNRKFVDSDFLDDLENVLEESDGESRGVHTDGMGVVAVGDIPAANLGAMDANSSDDMGDQHVDNVENVVISAPASDDAAAPVPSTPTTSLPISHATADSQPLPNTSSLNQQ